MTISRACACLDLAYDGTDFHGWARQKQAGLRTVRGVEDALSLIPAYRRRSHRRRAHRCGVHAHWQVAHLDVPAASLEQRTIAGDPTRLVRRLARLLPEDVRVHAVTAAPEGFDARFSALRRHYVYRVTTHSRGPLPTRARDTAHWLKPVDMGDMQTAADILIGLHDFAAFCKPREHATTIRELQAFTWHDVSTRLEPQTYEAHVTADASAGTWCARWWGRA